MSSKVQSQKDLMTPNEFVGPMPSDQISSFCMHVDMIPMFDLGSNRMSRDYFLCAFSPKFCK